MNRYDSFVLCQREFSHNIVYMMFSFIPVHYKKFHKWYLNYIQSHASDDLRNDDYFQDVYQFYFITYPFETHQKIYFPKLPITLANKLKKIQKKLDQDPSGFELVEGNGIFRIILYDLFVRDGRIFTSHDISEQTELMGINSNNYCEKTGDSYYVIYQQQNRNRNKKRIVVSKKM